MKKLALFISSYGIGYSPSLLNLLDFLGKIYSITLFLKDVALVPNDLHLKVKRIIEIRNRYRILYWIYSHLPFINIFDIYITVEPHGFFWCKKFFPDSRPIYYSLELYIKNDHFGLDYSDVICEFERKNINTIKGLIIQSKKKGDLFIKDYNLSENIPIFYLPVTYKGNSDKEKSNYLKSKYNISPDKKIALHLGGIAEWFSCIEIAREFSKLEKWVLIYHGYESIEYLKRFNDYIIEYKINNIIISNEKFENIDEIDKILKSCDIGIAWYNDISVGFRTAGKSSGKISAYLKYGLPVITNNYPESIDAIENKQAGVCINTIDQIPFAVKTISNNYEFYSSNAMKEYDINYNFENYKLTLLNFIGKSGAIREEGGNKADSEYWKDGYNGLKYSIVSKNDPIRKLIEKHIPSQNIYEQSCLEIGAYPGRYLAIFGNMGYILNGIDMYDKIEDSMKYWLSEKGYKIGLLKKSNFFDFEVKDKYDIVCSFGFIEHFLDWEFVIIKKYLLVKNNGYLIIFVPNFSGLIQKLLHFILDYKNYCRHNVKSMNPNKWITCFDKRNYKIIYKGYFGGFDFWVENQERNLFQKKLLGLILKIKSKLAYLPDCRLYSPYCGLIIKLLSD
jgi:2-polyprenyl-3-methyl-5-hydroxy-6-metoxy-1,4-benzoquinol methylase